jgi:hypothetical protein
VWPVAVPIDVDSRVALIHALIPLGLNAVAEALEAEMTALTGERYSRTGSSQEWCGGAGNRAPCTSWIRRYPSGSGG